MTMLKIEDFHKDHIKNAKEIALANYNEEKSNVTILPYIESIPDDDFESFADNGLGVSAFDGDNMVGFLCSVNPFENAFGSSQKGVFVPMGAHGAINKNRDDIYAQMYQSAAKKWVCAGAVSHAICLYANDEQTQARFFRYGFGLRCVDAIRTMDLISCKPSVGYEFSELLPSEYNSVYPLFSLLNEHYAKSPFFMNRELMPIEEFTESCGRIFVAKYKGELCAITNIVDSGETFIATGEKYLHCSDTFCIEKHRGNTVSQNLLNYIISTLKDEGVTHLGVDFESLNPNAYGFWLKYFIAYAHSVVRRVDDNILDFTNG